MALGGSVHMHHCVCVRVSLAGYCRWLICFPCRILKRKEVCVCVCGLEWQKGWRWGLHPKKGFLSRWQLQDWQDAILLGNDVSQPVSLPVRQPLTPLNLAFCWAVTGLALTLHVASLINCTMKHMNTRWELTSMNSPCHNTATGSPFDGINDDNSFVSLFLSLLYLSGTSQTHPHPAMDSVMFTASGWLSTHSDTRTRSGHCAGMEITISVCVCVRVKAREKERSLQHFLHSHIVNPFL